MSSTTGRQEATVAEEAVAALLGLELVRVHVTHAGVGSRENAVRFVYIYRNPTAEPVSVVPLIEMSHRIHHNMKVTDASERQLILLDSRVCREALQAVAFARGDQARRSFVALQRMLPALSARAIDKALASEDYRRDVELVFKSRFREAGVEGVAHAAVEARRAERTGAIARLQDSVGELLDIVPEAHRREASTGQVANAYLLAIRAAVRDAVRFIRTVETRKNAYVPFVRLEQPVAPGASVFLRVEMNKEVRPMWGARDPPPPSVTVRKRAVALGRWLTGLFGYSSAELEFPFATSSQSLHARVTAARGITLARRMRAVNFDDAIFQGDNHDNHFFSHTPSSIYVYRWGEQVKRYETLAAEKEATDRWWEQYRGAFWLRTRFYESLELRLVFYGGLAAAWFTAAASWPATIVLGLAAALVFRSLDRPFSQKFVLPRLAAMAATWAVAGLVA